MKGLDFFLGIIHSGHFQGLSAQVLKKDQKREKTLETFLHEKNNFNRMLNISSEKVKKYNN